MIESRLWLDAAKGLLRGADDKIVHKGCGDRPSLYIKNDEDRWWAYCHRCRDKGFVMRSNQRIKQKVAEKTGWYPEMLVPFIDAVNEDAYKFRVMFQRLGYLTKYASLLKFSPDTQRVYLPDASDSYLGIDATGQANARFYSPTKRNMATFDVGTTKPLIISASVEEYLEYVSLGLPAMLVLNRAAEKAALAELSRVYQTHSNVYLGAYIKASYRKDLRPFL